MFVLSYFPPIKLWKNTWHLSARLTWCAWRSCMNRQGGPFCWRKLNALRRRWWSSLPCRYRWYRTDIISPYKWKMIYHCDHWDCEQCSNIIGAIVKSVFCFVIMISVCVITSVPHWESISDGAVCGILSSYGRSGFGSTVSGGENGRRKQCRWHAGQFHDIYTALQKTSLTKPVESCIYIFTWSKQDKSTPN